MESLEVRVSNLEFWVGKLALQIEQFTRIGLADADNQFCCGNDEIEIDIAGLPPSFKQIFAPR